jgi:hypothetical protein
VTGGPDLIIKTRWMMAMAAAVGAALLAGCGGGESSESSTTPQGSGSVEAQLGFSAASTPEARTQVENDIAACMKAQGFDYATVDPVARHAALTGKSDLRDEDFTKQFGYGIATLYGRETDRSDPNARIRRNLSRADQRAYDNALTGGKPGQTYFRAADTGDFSELGGCTKQAADRLFGGSELLPALQQALDDLDQAVQQDQRFVRALEAWRQCVRDETGESFENSEGVELEIQRRLAAIVGPLPAGESAPGEFANHTPDRPVDRAALDRLEQLEVKYAVADTACEEKHLEPVEEVVTEEKEKEFRDRNAELLRQVKPLGTGS